MPHWGYLNVEEQLNNDALIVKPGFCRFSLTFFMSDAEASTVVVRPQQLTAEIFFDFVSPIK